MAILETLLLLVQTLALGGIAAALVLSQRQHRLAREEVRMAREDLDLQRESVQTQNILHALGLLRDQDFRKAVMVVRSRLKGRSVDSWEPGDTFHVLLVCSTYNFLGLLLKHEVVPRDLFLEHWGASVLDMYSALEEFINRRRRANPRYCADYVWLCEQALQSQRSAATSGEVSLQPTASATQPTHQVTSSVQ